MKKYVFLFFGFVPAVVLAIPLSYLTAGGFPLVLIPIMGWCGVAGLWFATKSAFNRACNIGVAKVKVLLWLGLAVALPSMLFMHSLAFDPEVPSPKSLFYAIASFGPMLVAAHFIETEDEGLQKNL